ncbi:hypothetical protein N7532_001267 [Penicillium argentinense]|uniref:Uncharacterized protein n=1 Tax=Penicillium argentinense TaxID=1131581 RepID=A0A9W9KMC0_9EURO|nr:uncharacterized protein N7532_001267 [Penicillium argentinense]KAJ5110732.1 hypothetical protein N7532_001267 [Penicillium argentinense]
MGQSQSTGSKGPSTPEQDSGQKTDYYELLDLTRSASDDEIKKAYRRKALELHPDRNYGNVEEATRLFAEVQSAYEVLADPQERAWYDSHSDAFLGTAQGSEGSEGGQHSYNIRITTAEDVLKVFSRFSPRMEFSDSPAGFFGGLQDQFAQLALEERLASEWENLEVVEYPAFGSRDAGFETVVRPFYAVWSGFSTKKSFAWKDVYRYSEAPDRRVRRLMEKENRRLRDEGIRAFNDAVRSLVAFVKKRDPRYKANAQNEAQRQETLRQSVAAQAARSRAMNNAKLREHVVPEWARSHEPDISDDEETSESEIESFECVACHKSFKSQNQFEAHEKSKKHLKAVKQLCREMRLQDEQLDLKPTTEPDAYDDKQGNNEEVDDAHISGISSLGPEIDIAETDELPCVEHKRGNTLSADEDTSSTPPDSKQDSSDSVDDGDYASRESIGTRLRSDLDLVHDPITPLTEQLSSSGLDERPRSPPVGKAKQRRAKKAAQNPGAAAGIACAKCHEIFPSKTKLFVHLQENPTHAQLKTTSKSRRR